MALNFNADGDNVDFGSATDIDSANLSRITMMLWIYSTSTSGTQVLYGKNTATFTAGFHMTLNLGGAGTIQIQRKATADIRYRTPTSSYAANEWTFLAGSYGVLDMTNEHHIFKGTLQTEAAELSYTDVNDGTGTITDDSAQNLYVGNSQGNTALEFKGDIGVVCLVNRQVPLQEVISWQYRPRWIDGTLLLSWLDGTGTQPDYSGLQRSGTVTGATQSVRGLPLRPRWSADQYVPYTAAAPPVGQVGNMLSLLGVG